MMCTITSFAEESLIKFRNIEWWTDYSHANYAILKDAGDSHHVVFENADIDSIENAEWWGIYSDDRVNEAGLSAFYYSIPVAGYTADVHVYYMYPIVDGKVEREKESAEIYFGMYEFEEFEDLRAVYDDLKEKLTTLYGDGEDRPTKYIDSTYWEDADHNCIWLVIDKDSDYAQVRLAYAAGDSKARLIGINDQLSLEKLEAENASRAANTENTSGL